MFLSALVATAILGFAEAKMYTNITVPVNIDARQGHFNIPPLMDASNVTWFSQNFTRRGGNFTPPSLTGYNNTRGTYNISAKICTLNNGSITAF
jgi:hypothetical protein